MGGRGRGSGGPDNRRNRSRNDNGDHGGGGGGGDRGKQGNYGTGDIDNGGGDGSGGGGTTNPPIPPAWPDNLRRKAHNRRRRVVDLAADIEAVNPRWLERTPGNEDTNEQWDINCTRCSLAVEFRARGYDVTALPKPRSVTDNDHFNIEDHWRDGDGNRRKFTYLRFLNKADFRSNLKKDLLDQGDGARGFIIVEWKDGGGHIFNYEVRGDKILFLDGQTNEYNVGNSWINDINLDSWWNGYLRTDDLTPRETAMDWIRQRTDAEINAPSEKETLQEALRRYGDESPESNALRSAFRTGWHLIRTGQDPVPPDYFEGFPELIEAFEKGVEWARRPD